MSNYTRIEADEPLTETPQIPLEAPSPQQYEQGPIGVAQPLNHPTSWVQKLKQSSHPIALLFYMFFRISPIVIYIFGNIVISLIASNNKFIIHFITIILLISADFWNLKNISGRLLVGLRWWNEIEKIEGEEGEFENVWVFESCDPTKYINPIDSKVFWLFLYLNPIAWFVLGFLALLKFQFLYLLLIVIALFLSITNGLAFTKCDKFGKANNIANDIFSKASGTIFSRLNPFG
ncbi:unnamed protein product [Candida verbasci]|uniref:Golgi apparatus membrane protein TVP23 n=1 Tax=Candida verbasci TaxID=1227364 RepID=A0A9W4TV01_9ASCO|nr:unnamed protein product [Candida verbasci]